MNTISLTGGLTRDPELRCTPSGKSICDMRLAVTRPRNRDKSDYFDVVAWEGLAETCAAHLEKGRQLAVAGRVEYREWETDDGTRRSSYSVIADQVDFLDRPREHDTDNQADPAPADQPAEKPVAF
jgi:single-strand DNA-binding protein